MLHVVRASHMPCTGEGRLLVSCSDTPHTWTAYQVPMHGVVATEKKLHVVAIPHILRTGVYGLHVLPSFPSRIPCKVSVDQFSICSPTANLRMPRAVAASYIHRIYVYPHSHLGSLNIPEDSPVARYAGCIYLAIPDPGPHSSSV